LRSRTTLSYLPNCKKSKYLKAGMLIAVSWPSTLSSSKQILWGFKIEMRRTKGGVIALLFALAITSLSATAFGQTYQVDRREANQQRRIRRAYRSGNLTSHEYRRLQRREGRINAYEARARADGRLTQAERRRLNRRLNRTNHAIRREANDRQYRRHWRR
jgi:hypothetical protein